MLDYLSFLKNRLRERLWIKPLIICVLSIGAVLLANLLDRSALGRFLPEITKESNEALLTIMASSMLVMATFAVSSMVAAYASASTSATPRSFPLIIADDVSQNALSMFVGAFIYSVVALVALLNGQYDGRAGKFVLFTLSLVVVTTIIVTFVWWVDNIARLGRLGNTVDKVEAATDGALRKRQAMSRLGGVAIYSPPATSHAVYAKAVGYVRRVDVSAMQSRAVGSHLKIVVAALPGTFCTPNRPVAWIISESSEAVSGEDAEAIGAAFAIGDARVFDQDPRFGLVALSEIASRALSPAVNDPGTAIDVTGTLVRLFVMWNECCKAAGDMPVHFDRVAVPELSLDDMLDDAFTGIARDGAGLVEVVVRLLKGLESLAELGHPSLRESALRHARLALVRAESVMKVPEDITVVREVAKFALK